LLVVLFTALNTTDVLVAQPPGFVRSPEYRAMQQRAQEEEQQRAIFVAVGVGLIILGIAMGFYTYMKKRDKEQREWREQQDEKQRKWQEERDKK